jgi:hypothetical protein
VYHQIENTFTSLLKWAKPNIDHLPMLSTNQTPSTPFTIAKYYPIKHPHFPPIILPLTQPIIVLKFIALLAQQPNIVVIMLELSKLG